MCGIAGIISPRIGPADRELAVRRMIARQRHRGPDDEGVFSHGDATIGMCRLAIFDPANGRQPMSTADGRFHIVFNGAIYNFRELRAQLEPLGHSFRTNCDTEVLLAAYAQWGEDCLPRLRGMFAFCVLDTREHTAFLARGPLGVKPLYYALLPGNLFVFASELNGILVSGLIDCQIDPLAVGDYLAWFAVPAPRTIYRGISNLQPGHKIHIGPHDGFKTARWWRLPVARAYGEPTKGGRSYEEFVRELRAQLESTIQAHQLADVPVGAFLSGGVDSATIVALMSRRSGQKLKTFSLAFEEKEYSEGAAARETARELGTEHHEEVLTASQFANDLPNIIASFDQPSGDGFNTYYISRTARLGGVKVALSGLGSDELFGGYPSFREVPRLESMLPLWRWLPRSSRKMLRYCLGLRDARSQKVADVFEYAEDIHELCSWRRRILSEEARLSLLSPDTRQLVQAQGPNHPMLKDLASELIGADAFQIVSGWELRTYMADVLLRDSDVFSMVNSIEVRVPFVDMVFTEWFWNQPLRYKYGQGRPKAALVDAVRDQIPSNVLARPKRGFALPFPVWTKSLIRPYLNYIFSRESLANCPWLNARAVEVQYARFQSTKDSGIWLRVWALAMLIAFANRTPARS